MSSPRFTPVLLLAVALLPCCTNPTSGDEPKAAPTGAGTHGVQLGQYPSAPHEDRHGNLWFCCVFEGLTRFDGEQFVTFTEADGLASNTVRTILEDDDGTLWFATTGGLSKHDGATFTTVATYRGVTPTPGFGKHGHHRDLWDVHRDRQGNLWIASMDGVFRHDGEAFRPFALPTPGPDHSFEFTRKMVYDIFEDRQGRLWFGTDGAGAVRYDGAAFQVFTSKEHGLCSDRVTSVHQDTRGHFWFGSSDGGVSHYDGSSFTTHLRNKTFSQHMGWGRVMGCAEDAMGNLWFGIAGPVRGVYRYDGKAFRFFSEKHGLGDGHVSSVRVDRAGRVWLGTTAGVYRFDGQRFANFTKPR
tara:strand:+ start:1272 stop:2339 length:1068 start_codon:yes stop_codon:yes gene_type:complete